ncbi:2-C-methyl-D-erythritol 2,4-cyclodiphosphate synthase [Acetohalobium arabaticum]|uniref:2-C-methyl-D-erythritol 2,4-cyclodiphosphate synthase n=1 Tax=Acetohalobium arabaticum (strain ATCC 49924 / DSM 5501 / Z-7288) TaxID=574087 RepID=D9QT00_ACEAZ|nr:2-C-methyl-D-erythritol 2,4-cyclodiphosphate synthase [Acetohalobium arabaticum]ADL11688.1 2C-methyl-D-erythritol 2,4-cyclodiphosphate synthase [Acetohalobium arabaticum DSM 5501]
MRVGIGYDVHQLISGEDLILGGIKIDHSSGLKGHSDADVLLHAVMDAMLGAIGAGDIGKHFPDSDPAYEGISSLKLLSEVNSLLTKQGYSIINIDVTIIAQKPKLASYLEKMEKRIAEVLDISLTKINLKATTTEGLGYIGNEAGIAAQAIVSLESAGYE